MKKSVLLVGVALSALVFAGCSKSQTQANTKSTVIQSNQSKQSSNSHRNSAEQNSDPTKEKFDKITAPVSDLSDNQSWHATEIDNVKLDSYMQKFGDLMHQKYTPVTFKSNTKWYGINLSEYAKKNCKIEYQGNEEETSWFNVPTRYHEATNVRAVYADDANHVLYLFTDNEGGDYTYVSQQKPNAKGELVFKPTENATLNRDFPMCAYQDIDPKTGVTNSDTSDTQTSSKNDDQASSVAPVTQDEAVAAVKLALNSDIIGNKIETSKQYPGDAAHFIANADGSMSEWQYGGAKGIDKFEFIPNADNTITVNQALDR